MNGSFMSYCPQEVERTGFRNAKIRDTSLTPQTSFFQGTSSGYSVSREFLNSHSWLPTRDEDNVKHMGDCTLSFEGRGIETLPPLLILLRHPPTPTHTHSQGQNSQYSTSSIQPSEPPLKPQKQLAQSSSQTSQPKDEATKKVSKELILPHLVSFGRRGMRK